MQEIKITDIEGIKIGNEESLEGATGCTVIICEKGAVAGVDVRGGAPGTRETDLLRPENMVDKIHAIVLSGGSAFGLEACSGVMEFLEAKGVGFDVGVTKVPIVCGAVLFDLVCKNHKIRPDREMGYRACVRAYNSNFEEGTKGAGTGATVGKVKGIEYSMKGGLGSYCVKVGDLIVGAIVAVNCFGDVVDKNGNIIAGALDNDKKTFVDTEEYMIKNYRDKKNYFNGNTTIGAIITNAKLNKSEANKIASMAHDGYAQAIRPIHTMFDGDTIFSMSTEKVEADINIVGFLGARVMREAIVRGIKKATAIEKYITYADLSKC